jgi:hypothetical protein
MLFRKSKLIAQLREQIAYLLGRLEASEDKAEKMSEIARKALELANEKHFPQVADGPHELKRVWIDGQKVFDADRLITFYCPKCSYQESRGFGEFNNPITAECPECGYAGGSREPCQLDFKGDCESRYLPNQTLPQVKPCPSCSVSVRAEEWPQECPACHCTFGFPES